MTTRISELPQSYSMHALLLYILLDFFIIGYQEGNYKGEMLFLVLLLRNKALHGKH